MERIGVNRLARGGDPWRIRERQIELVRQRLGRRHRNLAGLRILVIRESALLKLFVHVLACETIGGGFNELTLLLRALSSGDEFSPARVSKLPPRWTTPGRAREGPQVG